MDYRPLIAEAMKHSRLRSRYAVAKALGYKQVSTIYKVEKGEAELSAGKLMKLLQLAGKTLAGAATISAALLALGTAPSPAQAETTGSNSTMCIM